MSMKPLVPPTALSLTERLESSSPTEDMINHVRNALGDATCRLYNALYGYGAEDPDDKIMDEIEAYIKSHL